MNGENMQKRFLSVFLVAASMAAPNLMADECRKGFQLVGVSGEVHTKVVINPDDLDTPTGVQAGTVTLKLDRLDPNKKAKTLFEQTGAVVGQVTGFVLPTPDPDSYPYPVVYLDHDMTFANGVTIETSGDQAVVYGDPFEASVQGTDVVETINNFSGTKNFRNATGTITAVGTINRFCDDYELCNDFMLDGEMCIKD